MKKILDRRLEAFFNDTNEVMPPAFNERLIQLEVNKRKNRWNIILLALGSLLWILAFAVIAIVLSKYSMLAAFALLGLSSLSIMSAGLFSCVLVKFRKVGVL